MYSLPKYKIWIFNTKIKWDLQYLKKAKTHLQKVGIINCTKRQKSQQVQHQSNNVAHIPHENLNKLHYHYYIMHMFMYDHGLTSKFGNIKTMMDR